MKDNETFKMTYSAEEQEEIRAIREKYVPKEQDKMDILRAMDAKVGKKASAVSIAVGTVGAVVMGFGMSLVMTDIGAAIGSAALPVGIAVGVIGMAALAAAYPIYCRILKSEREKVAPEILRLTDELMK